MFRCTSCGEVTLSILDAMQLGSDDWSDARAIQTVRCARCDFQGVARLETERHGGDESFRHWVSALAPDAVRAAVQACSSPGEPRCQCEAHQRMRTLFADRDAFREEVPLRSR